MSYHVAPHNEKLTYLLSGATWKLEFAPAALHTLYTHRQRYRSQKEKVGQLYTRDLTQPLIRVEKASLLAASRSTFASVSFDPKTAYRERVLLLQQGLHCIGLWHSHPEAQPHPSHEDLLLIADHAKAAQRNLAGLVFVIVGTRPFPGGLFVGVHDGSQMLTMAISENDELLSAPQN